MKCRACNTDIDEDAKFCVACGSAVVESSVVFCSGKQGIPCGAELQESFNFCKQCGKKVDRSLFQKNQTPCKGIKEDGSVCGRLLGDDINFCMECGTQVAALFKEADSFRSHKDFKTNNLLTDTTSSAPWQVQVFDLNAKLDREHVKLVNREPMSLSRFPISSTTVSSESLLSSGESVLQNSFDLESKLGQENKKDTWPVDSRGSDLQYKWGSILVDDPSVVDTGSTMSSTSPMEKDEFKTPIQSTQMQESTITCSVEEKREETYNDQIILADELSVVDTGSTMNSTNPVEKDELKTPIQSTQIQESISTCSVKEKKTDETNNDKIILADDLSVVDTGSTMNSTNPVEKDEFKTPIQSTQIQESISTCSVKEQKTDETNNDQIILADELSVVDTGSTMNSTNPVEKDELKTPIQSTQIQESISTCSVKEKKTDETNNDKIILADDLSVVDTGSTMNSTNPVEKDEFKTPIQSTQIHESISTYSVKEQKTDETNNDQIILADDLSVVDTGSTMNSTSPVEKDEFKTPIQSNQNLESTTACSMEENKREESNNDQTILADDPSVVDSDEYRTPIQGTQSLECTSASDVEEKRENKSNDQIEEKNSSPDVVPIQEPRVIEDLAVEKVINGIESKENKDGDENNDQKTQNSNKDGQNNQQESEEAKISKDEKNKKSKTESSNNTSSKNNVEDGSSAAQSTNQRKHSEHVRVHFHALLSPEFDLTPRDSVIVQFGEDVLGGWKSEIHKSQPVRKMDDQYTELKLDLDIPKRLIIKERNILYKYVVLKDKSHKDKEPKYLYEHYRAHGHANRTLHLPDNKKNLVEWHQYDGIIYPKPGEGFIDKLKSIFTGDVSEREKRDLVRSIQYFLPMLFQDLSYGPLPDISVDETLIQLEELLHCMKRVYFIDRNAFSLLSDYERKIADIILVPVLRSFEQVPLSNWEENPAESERRMLQATMLVSAQKRFKLKLNQEEQELMARGLMVRPNHKTRKCHDLICIDKYFPQEKKKQLSESLISFLESMALKAKSPFIFLCIPLHHFLTGALKPFGKMPEDFCHQSEIPKWWGIDLLTKAVDSIIKGGGFKWTVKLEQIVGILHPLFEMDYLLPRTFMAMLLQDELVEVIKTGKIPFEICAATLFFYVKVTRPGPSDYYIVSHNDRVIGDAIYTLGDVCRAVQISNERCDIIQARMFYKIAGDLLTQTLEPAPQFLVAGAVQVFLHAVAVYDILQRIENSQKPNIQQDSEHFAVLRRLYEGVTNWHGTRFRNWTTCLEDYLLWWDGILAPVDLPSEAVKEAWNLEAEKYLNCTLRGEMQRVPGRYLTKELLHLYCAKVHTFHPVVQDCLSQLAFKAIETGYSVQMQQLGDHERVRFGKLLSDLFESEWDRAMKRKDAADRLILYHILKWTPFSHFLKMFYGEERKMNLLSQTCIIELTQAVSVIDQRISALADGTITFRDLDVIKEAKEKFLELTMIMSAKSDEKKGKKHDVLKALKVRQKEVDSYHAQKKYVMTLIILCQHIPSVQCTKLNSTIKSLDEKNDLCIKDICQPAVLESTAPDKFQPQITAFKLSYQVISMLEPLHASNSGNIFLELWRDTGRTSQAVNFDELYEHVWKPVYSRMKDITQKLVTGEIQFVDMERYLGNIYKEDYEQMVQEMILINVPEEKGRERVKQLAQFRQMEACFHGSETILNVVTAYKLRGDFNVIKAIASVENAAYKMMKEFDDSLLTTCGFLEELTSEKTSCLDVFITCKPLVLWLRESMKGGLKELKVFVDLASMSAGEGDMETDKVNCLHAATTGYASLIFDLDEDSGYKELWDKCQILWKELKADPNLPKKLLDTNRHLEWLKTVKQAHGSVEVTSLAQTEAISSKGVFYVGALNATRNTTMGLDLQNTLQLKVPGLDKESQDHKQYTFEQLQDLQSRLMLVAGKAEQRKDDVNKFTLVFDSVTRLANVFIKLNSAGCVLFKHWQTKFICDPSRSVCAFIEFGQGAKPLKGRQTSKDDVTTVIPKIAKFMENCLKRWIEHINKTRVEYLELNYFTTDQLVILQQELVKVGPNQGPDIKIYPLLSAVKENCTYEDLVDAMKKASEDLKVVQMEVDEEHKETKEDEEVAFIETKDKESRQKFIAEMITSGFSEKLAEAALRHVKPNEITEGVIWCGDHLDEEDIFAEEDTEMGEGNHPVKEATPYEGWKKSVQSSMSVTAAIVNRLEVAKGDMDVDPLITDMEKLWEEFLTSVSTSVADYLSVEHLGLILKRLAEKDHRTINRPFPQSFISGTPNLIICPKADVFSTVLSIYMMDANQPLPQADEVLMCTPQTTLDQLDVFWRRTVADTSSKIHCLVNGDHLDFEVSDRGERRLEQYMQQTKNLGLPYRLVVVCSAENEYKSQIITALDKYRRPPLPIPDIHHIADYVRGKLQVQEGNTVATVDFDRSTVRVVKSWRAGVGKSLYVRRKNEELMQKNPHHKMTDLVNIPLQDKEINVSEVTQILLTNILPPGVTTPRIFHLDIAHEVQEGVDYLLFNLVILGCLTDKSGYVWRRSPRDLYLIETLPIVELTRARKGGRASYVHHVFDFLPFLTCWSPQESLDILTNRPKPRDFKEDDPQFDLKEFTGTVFQRPYQYLSRFDQGCGVSDVDPNVPWGTPADCLKVLLKHCGVPDPSWAELHHFVWFLNTQLMDFEKSNFCSASVSEDLPGFSKFVLRFLIQMSRDFSTRSLLMSEESPATMMEVDEEEEEGMEDSDKDGEEGLSQYQMRRTWESSPHPYLFFNPDGHTITFLGFNIERKTGNLIDQQTRRVLETAIMPQILYDSLVRNRVPIQENFDSLPRDKKIERLCLVMGNEMPHDPDDTYELTTDNVKKILAIYMRFRCDIPVIIMGETGCGKTRLVKFMCALQTPPGTDVKNVILMKVHGGTTTADIKRKVEEARKIAQQNTVQYGPHMYTVLFFDEANATEAIGMIKEIMCDRSMEGRPLDQCQNLKFVAACNPYKKHSEALIKRLEQAGLGYHVDADKTTDRLGRVPMRRLVYRVQPLPQSLLPLVWDFGQLNTQIEDLYIRQMVRRYIRNGRLPNIPGLIEVISEVLTASQDFMRQQEDECSFVSLRDVERVLNVMSWLYAQSQEGRTLFNSMDEMKPFSTDNEGSIKEKTEEDEDSEEFLDAVDEVQNQDHDDITRSLVLALGVCYHACLKNRAEYRRHVAHFFRAPCNLPHGPDQIEKEISICQDVFLENVQLDKNIARNTALKENVFMMVTSIELRIPLFLVGKPGSSKSLAKTIVADAMQGNAAHKDLFKEFKQVQMVSFQCSPLSTPDGIVGTFRQCAQFQKDKDLDRFVSVVVLDEVGLAEDSPRMPLKTLHPLLEDGCQGDEEPQKYKKVAFIGISNWALDPAKMNRGILVQREVPDLEELKNTAEGICGTRTHVYKCVKPFIEPLARSYLDLFGEASVKLREFFGLRDFYSLMKMIYSFVEQTNKPPTWHQLLHSIKRNFGGLDAIKPVDTFAKRLTMVDRDAERRDGDPDCKTAGLIEACLFDTNNTQSESRYLLLLTENYGALTILQQLIPTNNIITIFGSSFPSDQEYTQVCRNINRIKVCMETGNTVVLLNLENLYESLYDALNQYYVNFGGERYVDLGLGTHRVKCRVHKKFRLIVVAEKDVVYKKFPIPLINRLEKHFLTVNTILTREQSQLAADLEKWVEDFSTETASSVYMPRNEKNKSACSVEEVFIGYHADTCSSIILHVWQRLQALEQTPRHDTQKILEEAKRLLLWCATPDAVVRLERCDLDPQEKIMLKQVYMREQCHDSLFQYLHFMLKRERIKELFAQITTHSKLLSTADKTDIHREVGIPPRSIAMETLQSFDTEQQFSRKIRSFMESNPEEELLLMIQCDSGDTSANLVASARYCVLDEHQQLKNRRTAPCHVIFIIQLPRIAGGCFTGFQCGLWHSAHIDDLRAQDEEMPSIMEMLGMSVGTLMERATNTADVEMEETFRANRFHHGPDTMETNDMDTERNDSEIPGQVKTEGMEWEGKGFEKLPDDQHQDQGVYQDVIYQRVDHKLNVRSLILSCVQPALAMVKDKEETTDRSTRRIELMLYLLHQNPIEDLPTFLHGLSCHIATLLKEKEKTAFRADSWLSSEAARPENINKTGTFRRACIQYLESKISPILAGIIAHIDTNHNLDLIHNFLTSGDWKARLWLQILNTPAAIQLQYSDLQSPTRQQELNEVVVKTTGCEGQMFTAVMPFSWLIYEQIDSIWRTAQENQEEEEVHMKMDRVVGLVKESRLGQLLETLENSVSSEDVCHLYSEDFTYMVYHAQSTVEHELVHNAIMQTSAILLEDTSPSILARLVSIHESHNKIVQHLRYFRSINQVWPECAAAIRTMQEQNPNHFLLASEQFTLAVLGLHLLIEQLSPPDPNYLSNAESRHEWLRKICNYRPVIEKGLALYSSASGTRVDQAVVNTKQLWTRITVVKLCIEHLIMSDKEGEKHGLKNVMPLWVMLGDSPDLKQLRSLEIVEKFLKMCNRAAIKELLGQEQACCYCEDKIEGAPVLLPCKDTICIRCYREAKATGTKKCPKCSQDIPNTFSPEATGNERKGVKEFKEYQSRCNSFFMDVVTQLCFDDNTAPSDQVVDKLLGYITMTTTPGKQGRMETRQLTKELTIFNDCVDPNPVFRSFLLQLLLRTSEEKVHSNLEKYFSQAHVVIGQDDTDKETNMVQLWQLVVQCLEDSFYLDCTKEDEVALATDHLIDAEHDIKAGPSMLQRLYGIAKARFGLAITAKHIHETVLKKGQIATPQEHQLFDRAATLCEGDCKWPKIYFIKYLCRCYGVDSYQAVCTKNDARYLGWIKYQPVEERDKVREVSDRYIVFGPHYVNIREAVTKVVFGEGTDQLDKAIKDTRMPENKKEILLCLALHREITMSRLQEVDKNKVTPEVIDVLQKYCSNTRFMKNKEVAQKILQNTYGIQSPILTVTPGLDLKQQGVLCLLMHCDIVLRNANGDRTLVEPLIRLATRPQTMRDAFIPTMPQDDVQEIKEVLLVNRGEDNPVFYRCPNGHPYVIGDCGRPYTVSKCPKCGLEIGGQGHVAHPGNAPDPGVDRTETGHILGRAENRTQIGPERTLTPAYCGIIRLLTHLTMMLGANIDSLALSQLIKPDITDNMVSQFLWQHIEHDLNDLHRALGKSLDDVFIIMHSILSGVMECPRENKIGKEICGLVSKGARNEWEKKFSEKFVAPALQKMEVLLKECNQQLAEDKRLGSDPLLCLLYEITQPQEKTPLEMLQENPAMWRFRSQITMDHLRHEFEVRMTGTKKAQRQHMILQLFLKEEHHLRAIRYLPGILKLQRILFQKYQRKLDRAEASNITVEMLRKESDGDELPKLLDEYAEVWDLVRENLVFVPKEYRRHRIDDSTPVSQLLPTASDAGQCAYSVLEFLFRKQNDFLDNYYQKAKRRVTEIPSVKVRDITPAHLISYHPEQDILPLVLANCNYSFEVGKGTTIEYNFANLERQIIDRFLFGKCFIDIEIELMVYRAEYTNSTVFRKLQEKIPQESLSSGIKRKISEEFRSLPNLCQALDNLDIAISFLKSIGGNPDNNLDKFMVETLRMEQSLYSPKAKQICQYQHAKSLWLLLSLEKTKQLALHNQVIFDGLPEYFHEDLSAELTEHVMTFLQPLSLERLELLLDLMFECIVLVISLPQNPDDEDYVDAKEQKFKDYMFALMTEKDQEFHIVGLDTFPDDVLSKFCVATWTLTYQCLQQKKRQRY